MLSSVFSAFKPSVCKNKKPYLANRSWLAGRYKYLLTGVVCCLVRTQPTTYPGNFQVSYPLTDIANQNFQPGSDYLKSVANQARKAYCGYVDITNSVPDVTDAIPGPLKALQKEFERSLCEMPADPVPLPPPNRGDSSAGKCACQPYFVTTKQFVNGSFIGTDARPILGPVSLFSESRGSGSSATNVVGLVGRGNAGGACSPNPVKVDLVQTGSASQPTLEIVSITPYTAGGQTFTDCNRPTIPTDLPKTPTDRPLPTISIPLPNLPPINLPVIPLPKIVLPGVDFKPSLTVDVGGININFSIGNVDFSFSPTLVAPIVITPPGFIQPTLPPSVNPSPSPGSRDCCDEIINKIELARGEIEIVRAKAIEGLSLSGSILSNATNFQNVKLGHIETCVCPPDTEIFASIGNAQDYLFPAGEQEIAFTTVRLVSGGLSRKTFGTPNGETVTFIGWYAFGRSGRWGERKQLEYSNNLLIPPGRGWNTFTFSLYNDLRANLQVFTYKAQN